MKKSFRVEKVLQRKDNKIYVKWEGYDTSFNNCIDKKLNQIYLIIQQKQI